VVFAWNGGWVDGVESGFWDVMVVKGERGG